MRQKTLLSKLMLLLCALIVGSGSAWADKINDYTSIVSGTQYYIGATTGNTDYYLSVDGSSTSNSIAGTAVTSKANATAFTFTGSDASWTVQFGSGYYLSLKSTKDNGKVQVVENAATFTASNQSSKIRLTIGNYSIQKNNSGTQFGSYGNTQTDIWLEIATPSYTITPASNNTSWGTVSLSGNAITAIPATGYTYADPAYTVSPANSATVVQNGNEFTVTPSANTTVTINFEAIPTHTATFSVNGNTSSQSFAEGANITFPNDPADVNGKTFVGWVTTPFDGTTDVAPTFVTSATMGNADVTYYAVFAVVEPGNEVDTSLTIDAEQNDEGFPTSYSAADNYLLSGVSFNILQGYKNGSKLQWRAAGNNAGTGTMYNNDALTKIQSIVLTYDSSDSNKNFTIKIGDSANPTSGTEIIPTTNNLVYTFDCSSYNKNYFVLTNGSNAGYLTSIVINYKSGSAYTYSGYCTTVAAAVAVTSVSVDATASVNVGETTTLTATVLPNNATNKNVTWESDDENVATVDANGVVTGVAAGTATITVTSVADNTKTATCTVTVNTVAVTSVSVDATASVSVGGTTTLTATVSPSNATNKNVTWESDDEDVATVDANGVVTGIAAGTAIITVKSAEDANITASCTVTVSVVPGTAARPYTVAEARDAIDAGTGVTSVYATGIVSAIPTAWSTQYNNITFNIVDNSGDTNFLQAYRCASSANADASKVSVGDIVVVKGSLTTHGDIYEFGQGCVLVSLTQKEAATITVTGGTEFTINRENDEEELTLSATANSGATVTFSVDATNSTLIEDDDFLFENSTLTMYSDKGGVVVIKANAPAAGDYKAATEVTITVTVLGKKSPAIIIVQDDNVDYGQTYTVDATMIKGGDITVTSSNENVATVNGLVITPVAVGTTTITVVTAENAQYKAGRETFTLTVNAPEGQTTAAASTSTVFKETFAESTGTAGWSGNAASGTINYDNDGWQSEKASGNGGSAKFGTGSAKGYAITPSFGVAGDLTLRFKSGAWNGDKTEEGLVLSVEEGEGTLSSTTFNLTDSEWSNYVVSISGATAGTKIKFSAAQTSKNRFFLDDVVVTTTGASITATLNGSGYATFCSEYPLDFTSATGYSAWQITDISSENVITFSQVKGSVKGGTGLLLKGEAGATITLTSVNSTNELNDNLLEGTLAPTYVATGDYYGLSGNQFVKVNAGTVPAGKALLPASEVNNVSGNARLSFVFEDDNTTTGISEELRVKSEESFYNLNGQRVNDLKKGGLYIMNGKKVIVK